MMIRLCQLRFLLQSLQDQEMQPSHQPMSTNVCYPRRRTCTIDIGLSHQVDAVTASLAEAII